jgi:hypothetical protein
MKIIFIYDVDDDDGDDDDDDTEEEEEENNCGRKMFHNHYLFSIGLVVV